MGWQLTRAVAEFSAEAGEFLLADRCSNTVLLTVTETLRVAGTIPSAGDMPPLFGWWRPDGATVRGAFLHTPPHHVLLTAMPPEAGADLAGLLAADGRPVTGVNGEEETANAFAGIWRDRTGRDARVFRRNRLFRLGQLTWPEPRPDGLARPATAGDRDLLIEWFGAFSRDVGEPGMGSAGVVDDRLGYGGMTIWEAAGQPVSLAALSRRVAGMVRVGPVYTPAELRGRGYAGGATSAASQAALDAGATDVLLFTDLANPTSNALYQRLGYRAVEDRLVLSFG